MFDESEELEEALLAAPPPPPAAPPAAVATAKVEGTAGSVSFVVPRRVTCASDNKPHKVTVAILNLKASFRLFIVPALSDKAYLQAITRNDSQFQFLPSTKVSIFVDNNFISTSDMGDVAPGESFRTFVGVDSALRVDYRNKGRVHSNRTALLGVGKKTEAYTYSFLTTLKNTRPTPVQVVLADILPRPSSERVRVELLNPTAEEVAKGSHGAESGDAAGGGTGAVAQNPATNNIVWNLQVAPNATVSVPFEYAIEYPQGETLYVE
eukprot:TRINITY_DN4931_c0_g1_i1.p1 TRINITY_DN4931_c0_g1~~TRINITY_DN4931_c0_g1_i1.p1  ORF type:complete len:266 (+),score=89.27 TRINITY_DN4931_c0_g1_i1:116-913(+)